MNDNENGGYQGVRLTDTGTKVGLCKSFVRTDHLTSFKIHTHVTRSVTHIKITSDNKRACEEDFCNIDETALRDSHLHLNHYAIQSFDWFMRVKSTRGDVNDVSLKSVRDETYFYAFDKASSDIHEIFDYINK